MRITSNNAITCSTDYNYKHYLYKLLDSIKENNVDVDVYVRLVDFTVEQINEVKLQYDANFIIDRPELSNVKNILKDIGKSMHYNFDVNILKQGKKNINKLLYSKRSVYTCHSRFKTINKLLQYNYNFVLSLDVDTLIKKDINHLFDKKDKDLWVVPTIEEEIEYYFHNEGLLLIKNTNKSKVFFKEIERYIFNNKRYEEWNVDSEALEYTQEKYPLSLGFLDILYKDKHFNKDAYMWSGDSINKFNKKFI